LSICKKCNTEFTPSKGLKHYCSLSCRNSRGPWSEAHKKIISKKLSGRKLSESCKKKLRGKNNPNWKGGISSPDVYVIKKCSYCNVEFKCYTGRKTCSRECQIKACTNRKYQNGSRKTYYYKSIVLESSWELEIAKLLDSKGINWIRPKPIKWYDNDKERLYYPDFYLDDYNLFLDPKNPYCMKLDSKKMNIIRKQINIVYGDIDLIKKTIENLLGVGP
jgi:hypothetical protein